MNVMDDYSKSQIDIIKKLNNGSNCLYERLVNMIKILKKGIVLWEN